MLRIPLGLDETVIKRQRPRVKMWKTIGEPNLLVMGAYRMGFRVKPAAGGSRLNVFIDYALPRAIIGKVLGRSLAPLYARWCCKQMVEDAIRAFFNAREAPRATRV